MFVCKKCGKEYDVDISKGSFRNDGTQRKGTGGVSAQNFCSFECGMAYRKEKISAKWKDKSESELQELAARRGITHKPKICKCCGKSFVPAKASPAIYCSDECRDKMRLKIPSSGKRVCKECQKEYAYVENQGSWNAQGELAVIKGKGHGFIINSKNFCSYECGIKHKERKRKETNIEKYGYNSPFENIEKREEIFTKLKADGMLFASKAEQEIKEFVESLGCVTEKYIFGNGLSEDSKRFEIDIYVPALKFGIEYNGVYYHSLNGKKRDSITRNYHFNKSKTAQSLDIEIMHIWEDQWIQHKDLVKTIIRARTQKLDKTKRVYARQCTIRELSVKEYQDFVQINHIQGYKKAKIKLGLFYNNELVQIASFSKVTNTGKAKSINARYDYEWVRGCPASNNTVVGGTSKLFKHFLKTYSPNAVLCYADWNLFNGNGYKECGFELDGYTGPDKFYVNPRPIYRVNRNPYKYQEFKDKVNQNKLWECYGAGSLRFIWKKL